VRLAASQATACLLSLGSHRAHTGRVRAVSLVFAIIGGCALVAAVVAELVAGDPAGVGWVLIGPAPFYAVGLAGAFRGPGRGVAAWLLASGALFMLDVCLGGVLQFVTYSSLAWVVVLVRTCAAVASVVTGIGLIGLFPTGKTARPAERWVIAVTAPVALALPLLLFVSGPLAPPEVFPESSRDIASPLYMAAAAPVAPVATAIYLSSPAWIILGVIMLYWRYRHAHPGQRRQIRQALVGLTCAVMIFAVLLALAWTGGPGLATAVVIIVLWLLGMALVLGSLVVSLSFEGVFGIDRPTRRSLVHRALRVLIGIGFVAMAATLGIVTSHYLPVGVAVVLAVGATLLGQPAQRRLERVADRWAFGARLDGYEVLTRFGSMLETSPAPDELLTSLADAIRRSLLLEWARVRLDIASAAGGRMLVGAAGVDAAEPAAPALVVPLAHSGEMLGAIECGPRPDGPLLEEDRRLLAHLANQAATAVRNLQLSAQLAARLEVIRQQAAELTASRARVAQAQDAERQRIQRDLHDGFQQDLVTLTAKLALAREQLRRGDQRGGQALDDLQRDLGAALVHLREFAHSIHPPVLADQGLLEAIEAQAARMPVETIIEADPALRGVRYPRHIEAATWYFVAEALTNAVKHAGARQVIVGLAQPNGCLSVEVSDDGDGFDPAAVRGIGLAGLADRVSIVNGALTIDSRPGHGTRLRAEVPLPAPEQAENGAPEDNPVRVSAGDRTAGERGSGR
jgi:signal transduction histidine kinase